VEAEEEFAEEEAKEAEKARLDASIEQAEEESAEKEKDDEEEAKEDEEEDEGQDEERYDGEDEEAVHDDELGLDMTPEDSIGSSEEQIETEPVDTQGHEREGTQSVEVGHHDENDVESGSEMDILAREVPRTEVEAEEEWKTKGLADYEDHDREAQHEEGDMTQMGHQRESYEQGRSFPELSEETTVDCGGHHAATCADCPWGMGAAWCNGNCIWANGACIRAAANLEASPHEEVQARSKGTPAWKEANHLPFKPTLQQQLADLVPRTLEDQEAAWRRRVLELTSGLPQEQPSDLQQQVSELLGLGKASALQRQMADLVGLPIS